MTYWDVVGSFSVERRRVPGIWKLKSDSLPFEQDIRSKLKGIILDGKPWQDDEVLIKLNPDGSFKQCNEGYREGRWLVGKWEVNDGQELLLALRRQYYGPQFDVLLQGRLDATGSFKVAEGKILKGKFMYQPTHPNFFDSPLVHSEALGNFTLEQYVSTTSVAPVRVSDPRTKNRFERSDFYDRRFIMTFEPIEMQQTPTGTKKEPLNLPVDIRVMPIQFFANNTFQAIGANKILRGRFDISRDDQLTFEVSLFGMGRSVLGSVFSEGMGVSHEDERSYQGDIDELDGKLRVEGFVTYGADLGEDARPEPVGRFLLTEISIHDEDVFFDLADKDSGVFE